MAVWDNPQIACICSQMPNMTILKANTAAALNRTTLSSQDLGQLRQYAYETAPDYCAGCTHICESVLAERVPVGDVMRYLMYGRSYGERDRAAAYFNRILQSTRRRITNLDYSIAEQHCPQKMPIGRLMREAVDEFA